MSWGTGIMLPEISGMDCGFPRQNSSEPAGYAENLYNNRVLLHNWYEDRRQFNQNEPRCTGHSIYKTDYIKPCSSKCQDDLSSKYARIGKLDSEGMDFLGKGCCCEYDENFTTTYDLMYNWEIRRGYVRPKPRRKWKLIMDASWQPQQDLTVPFGNMTTIGFRQSPQVPLVPRDWETFQFKTSYGEEFYPKSSATCRFAPPSCIRKTTEKMCLVPRVKREEWIPSSYDCCGQESQIDSFKDETCHPPRFGSLVPQGTLDPVDECPAQNVLPAGYPFHLPSNKKTSLRSILKKPTVICSKD